MVPATLNKAAIIVSHGTSLETRISNSCPPQMSAILKTTISNANEESLRISFCELGSALCFEE